MVLKRSERVNQKSKKPRAAISVCFYHDQNYELTILKIYVQESKKEREKSGERKEKFKVCGVVVVCSIRVSAQQAVVVRTLTEALL